MTQQIMVTLEAPNGEQQRVFKADEYPGYEGWTVVVEEAWPTLAMVKADRSAAVDLRLTQAFLGGFTPASGPVAGHKLQVRNNEDRTNWLTSQAAYSAAVVAGQGAVVDAAFRDADNVTVDCSYADGLATLLAMAAWGKALMENSWRLKDAIAAAADQASLDAIDLDGGWQ